MSQTSPWELTGEEAGLIGRYLAFYRSLDRGERRPATPAQAQFVRVCRGERRAETPHERAYVKHRMWAAGHRTSESSAIDEFEEGTPGPGWFSDDGWRRMRGHYLSNSD